MKKTNLGPVAVKLTRESTNALLQSLNQLYAIDTENSVSQSARKLMQKIIRHGRTFSQGENDKVSIYFYDNEASQLIELTSLFLSALLDCEDDYYERIGLSRKRGLGIPQSAEQNFSGDTQS